MQKISVLVLRKMDYFFCINPLKFVNHFLIMQKNMAWYAENFNVSESRFFDEKTIKNEKKIKKKSKNEQKYFF